MNRFQVFIIKLIFYYRCCYQRNCLHIVVEWISLVYEKFHGAFWSSTCALWLVKITCWPKNLGWLALNPTAYPTRIRIGVGQTIWKSFKLLVEFGFLSQYHQRFVRKWSKQEKKNSKKIPNYFFNEILGNFIDYSCSEITKTFVVIFWGSTTLMNNASNFDCPKKHEYG